MPSEVDKFVEENVALYCELNSLLINDEISSDSDYFSGLAKEMIKILLDKGYVIEDRWSLFLSVYAEIIRDPALFSRIVADDKHREYIKAKIAGAIDELDSGSELQSDSDSEYDRTDILVAASPVPEPSLFSDLAANPLDGNDETYVAEFIDRLVDCDLELDSDAGLYSDAGLDNDAELFLGPADNLMRGGALERERNAIKKNAKTGQYETPSLISKLFLSKVIEELGEPDCDTVTKYEILNSELSAFEDIVYSTDELYMLGVHLGNHADGVFLSEISDVSKGIFLKWKAIVSSAIRHMAKVDIDKVDKLNKKAANALAYIIMYTVPNAINEDIANYKKQPSSPLKKEQEINGEREKRKDRNISRKVERKVKRLIDKHAKSHRKVTSPMLNWLSAARRIGVVNKGNGNIRKKSADQGAAADLRLSKSKVGPK